MRDAFVAEIEQLAQKDKDLLLITGDLGFGIFDNFVRRFPNQFINAGVAEQNMTGMAVGLALEGKNVFTYSLANFSTFRCVEQIRNDAAYHNANVTIVSSGGGFTYGSLGMSHHATEDLALMRCLPDICVVAPCTAWEAGQATKHLYNHLGVGYLRLEKGGATESLVDGVDFELGKSICVREGSDIAFIVTGGIFSEALKAAAQLSEVNISVKLISMHTIKPLDVEAVKSAALQTKCVLTIEEHNIIGGLCGAVSEAITLNNLNTTFGAIALNDCYCSKVGDQDYLRRSYQLCSLAIVDKAKELIQLK